MKNTPWHIDGDVIVVGYGAAGAAAAITAHDAGVQVIILEKQELQIPISNSFMSGAIFICHSDIEEARRYLEALSKVAEGLYWTEPDIIRVWAEYTAKNKEWFEKLGATLELYLHSGEQKLSGFSPVGAYRMRGMGPGMMRLLYNQVKARNIPTVYGTRAIGLFMNSKGEIMGVAAQRQADGKRINVRARRAVILASGGFEFDEETKLQYLKVYPCYFNCSPWNTGDGIRMAIEVGAQLWHMNCCSAGLAMKFPDVPTGLTPAFGGRPWLPPTPPSAVESAGEGQQSQTHTRVEVSAGYILTDRYGKRYTNENFKTHTVYYELALFDSQRLVYPRIPSYWIFDQKRIEAGPLPRVAGGAAGPARIYKWSADNSIELQRGWIKEGNTIRQLALNLDIDPQTLAETVDNYNRYCKIGVDAEFGRQPTTLMPLTTPPYYAVEMYPGGLNTLGGPRRNAKAQVMRANGSPIPRLYSAGELGSIYGMLYPGAGGNIAECIAFGRIAGENASGVAPL